MTSFELRPPPWIEAALHTARVLQVGGNARWAQSLGELGPFGGFQVEAVTGAGLDALGNPPVFFQSTLFGGRSLVGTAREVVVAQRAFIASRRRKGPRK